MVVWRVNFSTDHKLLPHVLLKPNLIKRIILILLIFKSVKVENHATCTQINAHKVGVIGISTNWLLLLRQSSCGKEDAVVQRRVSFSTETLLLKHVLLKPYLMLIIILGSLVSSSQTIRNNALYTAMDA